MDNFKHTEMITYFYLKNLRELLEYATNKNKTKEDYDTKKKIFEQVISENGLITTIVIKNNPDQTDKIKAYIAKLIPRAKPKNCEIAISWYIPLSFKTR